MAQCLEVAGIMIMRALILPWLAVWTSVLALCGIVFPVLTQQEALSFLAYKAAAGAGATALCLALVGAVVGRRRPLALAATVVGVLAGAYALGYSLAAHQERDRATRLTACAVRLTDIHNRVESYIARHGKYPARFADLEPPAVGSPGDEELFVLWPEGQPAERPEMVPPQKRVVAAERRPAHLSSPWRPLFPLPSFLDGSREFCQAYPDLAESLVEDPKQVEDHGRMMIGVPCNGPLSVGWDGSVRVPGGANTSVLGVRMR